MIRIPVEQIIRKIKEKTSYSEEAINDMISKKIKQLSGLITREGAARIVANELGVKLIEKISGKLKIKNILSGMRDVEVVGIVKQNFGVRDFSSSGRSGKVASLIIADETGSIRVVLWNDIADKVSSLKNGDVVKLVGGYVRENQGVKEVHLNSRSKIIINPPGEKVESIDLEYPRKRISELSESDRDVELRATIVQAFEPRFYEVCPVCGKKLVLSEGGFVCETHGHVEPKEAYVINLMVDDGSGTIRLVCFREQVLKVLNKNEEELLIIKDNPEKFDELRRELLGTEIIVQGRVSLNKMFGRLEFIAQNIKIPDYEKEIEKVKKELETTKQDKDIVQDSDVVNKQNKSDEDDSQPDIEEEEI